jgi:Domain of Unknown Function (DUF1080)
MSCTKQIALFNGTNLNGWYAFTDKEKKTDNPPSVYTVSDSMIRLNGEKVGYLMSLKSYENFELTAEFRWNTEKQYFRNNNVKNSGIMYHIPTDAPDILWPRGIQFQIKQGFTGDFVLLDSVTIKVKGEIKGAGKSVPVAKFKDNEKPVGEWNSVRIVSKNGVCTQFLNGQLVNEGTEASSKKGRILLQYEGSPIDFRRIVIRL